MNLRTGWGCMVKSAKNLNATPGFSFCKSILRLRLTCLSIPRVDPANAPIVAGHLQLMLRISLMILIGGIASIVQWGFVVGPADWMLRTCIAFPSWFHNSSIGFRSGLHPIPGICLACRWSRTLRVVWGRTLNQDKCLWTRQWNCETWAMKSFFGWVHSWVLYCVWK